MCRYDRKRDDLVPQAWKSTTHRRGAQHSSTLSTNGYTVADMRAFLAAVDEAEVSEGAKIRIEQSTLSESGRRTVTLSVDETYEPVAETTEKGEE